MDCNENINEFWDWQEEEYSLQRDPQKGISHCLWDEVNQDDDSLLYMLDDVQTPIKDCTEFGYHVFNTGENTNKASEECGESSQLKRRRMLQYDSNDTETTLCSEQLSSAVVNSKVREESVLDDELHENMQWTSGFSEGSCAPGHEGVCQSSEGWPVNCYDESDMDFCSDEMFACSVPEDQIHISGFLSRDPSDQIGISEFCNTPPECNRPPEMEVHTVPKVATPSPRIKFKGRKSFIKTPTKLVTSVAYPFALIKPSGVQGDVTLNDINQRIRPAPPPKLKTKDSICYPTSAFSGKPVIAKTKIRTEGGRGSITIMRTKG